MPDQTPDRSAAVFLSTQAVSPSHYPSRISGPPAQCRHSPLNGGWIDQWTGSLLSYRDSRSALDPAACHLGAWAVEGREGGNNLSCYETNASQTEA